MPLGHDLLARDERGWRIPREGTLSRAVYNEMVAALTEERSPDWSKINANRNKIRVLSYRIKHWDRVNKACREYHRKNYKGKASNKTGSKTHPEVQDQGGWKAADVSYIRFLVDEGGFRNVKLLPGGRWAATLRFMFTHAIVLGRMGDTAGYDDRWCYHHAADAIKALDEWNGIGEPQGWHRHPGTGRRVDEYGEEFIAL